MASKRKGEALEASHSKKADTLPGAVDCDVMCVNTIRGLGADMPQAGNSGHPGAPIGCAAMAHALWGYSMNFSPSNPHWINRDRFVLSNGHACALQYALLHMCGYDLSMVELKRFRQLHSKTPGHPECFATPGVEVCTGPLGQGISNAVGMAIASHHLHAKYNKPGFDIFDNYVFVICGDGCLQEGVSSEACSLAGHLGLGRLVVLYDDNGITIDGPTSLSFTENVASRFTSYGWDAHNFGDGNCDSKGIAATIQAAKNCKDRPSLIKISTVIAFGSLHQGSEKTHGAPLGAADIAQLKEKFHLKADEAFQIPAVVKAFYDKRSAEGNSKAVEWHKTFALYEAKYPSEAAEISRRFTGELPPNIIQSLPHYSPTDKAEATRAYSGKALNAVAAMLPEMIGGSADLTGSNSSGINGANDFQKNEFINRYIRFGVREHGMAAICNGLFAYGGMRPFGATFLNFVTYAWGAVRLSALSKFGVLYIATHDSIELGEDGPTHQPIESLSLIRATPNILEIRPADGNETSGGYAIWLENRTRPVVLALCRSPVPNLHGTTIDGTRKGAYILNEFSNNGSIKVILSGSGSELHLCLGARATLMSKGFDVRIVSFPCWSLFEDQSKEYKESVMCMSQRRATSCVTVYVEAGSTLGWDKYFDVHIGMTTFGASAPKSEVWKHFGITEDNIVEKTLQHIQTLTLTK